MHWCNNQFLLGYYPQLIMTHLSRNQSQVLFIVYCSICLQNNNTTNSGKWVYVHLQHWNWPSQAQMQHFGYNTSFTAKRIKTFLKKHIYVTHCIALALYIVLLEQICLAVADWPKPHYSKLNRRKQHLRLLLQKQNMGWQHVILNGIKIFAKILQLFRVVKNMPTLGKLQTQI